MSAPAVLHLDGGRFWAGGQNQVRLLMRGLEAAGVRQLCLAPRGSPLARRLREERLPVEEIRWRGGSDPRAAITFLRRFGRFDIAHAHDGRALQVAIVPALLRRTPLVVTRRVHFPTSALKWNRADVVVAISETVRRSLLDVGVDPGRIRLVHSGIDADEVRALPAAERPLRSQLGLAPEEFLIGNIGHLHGYKGQAVIPPAAARLPGIHWAILGEGPERATLEAAITAHEVADRVHLMGNVADARRALGEMDAFVFASIDEPLGTSVLDAMAAGVPVIGADAAGCAEILAPVHARTGATLFPPGDAAALADSVRRFRRDAELRAAALAAQAERLEAFTIRHTVEAMLGLYRELAGPR